LLIEELELSELVF
jgi:hypothetical protein